VRARRAGGAVGRHAGLGGAGAGGGGWAERYRARVDSWRLPASQAKRDELARAYGADGYALVSAVYAPFSPPWLRELPAVQALRVMLIQNYVRITDGKGREVVKRRESLETGG
jgi:hypothetical protein